MAKLGDGAIHASFTAGVWEAKANFSLTSDTGEAFGSIQVDLGDILDADTQIALGTDLDIILDQFRHHVSTSYDVTFG